jgi:hypothetical protein
VTVKIGTILASGGKAAALFNDDAFYYFGVARHIAQGDGSTFNGIDLTNGYHPLWLLLLVPIFAVFEEHAALVAVSILSAVLFLASAQLLDRIGRLINRPMAMVISSIPLMVAGATGPAYWFRGMETGLLLLSLLGLTCFFLQTRGLRFDTLDLRRCVLLGALISCILLSRLDAAFFLAVLACWLMISWRHHPWRVLWRKLLAVGAVPMVISGLYLTLNQLMFSTALPVSGQAKSLGGGVNGYDFVQFAGAPVLFGHSTWLGLLVVIAVPTSMLWSRNDKVLAELSTLAALVLAGTLLMIGYFSLTSSWQLWPWYFYAAPLAFALAGPGLINKTGWPDCKLRWLTMIALLIGLAVVGLRSTAYLSGSDANGYVAKAAGVAADIDSRIRPGAAVAVGDRAGSLGYHLEAPMVHLEGLVENADYLDSLRRGQVSKFLNNRQVEVYVRGDDEAGSLDVAAGPGCRKFVEPLQGRGPKTTIVVCDSDLMLTVPLDDTSYRVWRYRSELNR